MTADPCTCCYCTRPRGLVSDTPAMPPAPPELVKATTVRDVADRRAVEARERWSVAAEARQAFETGLRGRYKSHPHGIEQATRKERAELEGLMETAAALFVKYREAETTATQARQEHTAIQHRITQQIVSNW